MCREEGWRVALLPTLCVLLCFTSKCPATANTLRLQKTEKLCFFIVSVLHHILEDGLHCCLTVRFCEPLFFCVEFTFPLQHLEDVQLELAETLWTHRESVACLSWVTLRWPCGQSRVQHHPRVETAGLDSSIPQNCVRGLEKCWYIRDGCLFYCVAYLMKVFWKMIHIWQAHKHTNKHHYYNVIIQ